MENKKNIMTLTDENGNTVQYELLDIIQYDENLYVVFYPTVLDDTEVVILRVEDSENINESNYIVEEDKYIVNEVYKMFKEKYKDKIKFED